jgi:hypothetical protein
MTTSAIARPQNLVIESLKEPTAAQASHLIDQYQADIEPPKPPETVLLPRFRVGAFPKRVTATPSLEPPKPVMPRAPIAMQSVAVAVPTVVRSAPSFSY